MVPVTLYVAPSPSTNPSPPTVTPSLVNAVPSYTFSASAVFKVTSLFVIVRFPSVTTNFTLLKFLLVFVKSDVFSPIA